MSKNVALIVAGIVFTVVAVAHVLRLYYGLDISIGGIAVSRNVSVIGAIVSGVLALWMFLAACRCKGCSSCGCIKQ